MIGQTLKNRYRIEDEIGGGAMGQVYRATDSTTGDVVAVKVISEEYASDEDYRKRFAREAQALRNLQHANIVGYIDAFSVGGRACLVMEFFGGGTLQDMIETHPGGLPDGLFKRIALAVLDAMTAAHEAGIIHRDLKPTNILMSADGTPKIADFGLVRISQLSTMTASGMIMGTLEYMAPEAFDTLVRQDHRADIWALGVIMFQMLTGQMPFRGHNDTQIMGSILHDKPYSLYTYRKDVPGDWVLIIDHCLEKEPALRYQTVRDLMNDLRGDRATFQVGDQSIDEAANLLEQRLGGGPAIQPIAASEDPPTTRPQEGYQFQFLFGQEHKPPPDDFKTIVPPKARDIRNIPVETPSREGRRSVSMMVFGGVFAWMGMVALVGISLFSVFNLLQEEADRSVTPAAVIMVAVTGAILFAIGALLELPESDGTERLLLGALAFGGVLACALIVIGNLLGDGGFLVGVMGATLSIAATLMYLSVKGF